MHGLNQDIGLLANYFPVEPIVYPLQINQIHKIDFQAQKTNIDESLGCSTKVNEEDYYGCAKDIIARNLQINPKPGCTVPMFSNLFRQRYLCRTLYLFRHLSLISFLAILISEIRCLLCAQMKIWLVKQLRMVALSYGH